jgi:hypothetical protein
LLKAFVQSVAASRNFPIKKATRAFSLTSISCE